MTSPELPGIVKHGPWNPAGLTANDGFRTNSQKLRRTSCPGEKLTKLPADPPHQRVRVSFPPEFLPGLPLWVRPAPFTPLADQAGSSTQCKAAFRSARGHISQTRQGRRPNARRPSARGQRASPPAGQAGWAGTVQAEGQALCRKRVDAPSAHVIFGICGLFSLCTVFRPWGESGGTGRRARFRISWLLPWGFESPLSHPRHLNLRPPPTRVGYGNRPIRPPDRPGRAGLLAKAPHGYGSGGIGPVRAQQDRPEARGETQAPRLSQGQGPAPRGVADLRPRR